MILIGFLGNIVTLPLQFGLPLLIGEDIAAIINALLGIGISLLLTPLTYIALTLVYYDLRVRKEGYDIELMTEHLEQVPENSIQE
jgi:hypothetical protein